MHVRFGHPRCCLALAILLAGCAAPPSQPTAAPQATSAASTSAPAAVSPAASPSIARPEASPSPATSPSPRAALPSGPVQLGSLTFNNRGLQDARGKDGLELEADDFYFRPTFIQGTPGQKLKLEIANEGKVQHNFSLEAQQIDQNIAPDGTIEVEVTVPPSGALRFFCKFHVGQGMNGELLAGDAQPQPVSATPGAGPGY